MQSHPLRYTPDNYLIVNSKVGNKFVNMLIDTGAQPTVIKLSTVPLGSPITQKDWFIKGLQGPKINICGTADIPFEIGSAFFIQNCIVVEDDAMDFPAEADVILGANFLVHNRVDISTSQWALMKDGEVLQHLQPSYVDGKLFSAADIDYIYNTDLCNTQEPEVEDEVDVQVSSPCVLVQSSESTNLTV